MINDFEFYHGAVIARMLSRITEGFAIKNFSSSSNASYVINNKIGIYIKYSTSRLSPWRFSFAKEHQDAILEMQNTLLNVFVLLVCKDDGIVSLSFLELKNLLDETHEKVEWIAVWRNKKQKYKVKGKNGELKRKIGQSEFPSKIFQNIITESKTTLFSKSILTRMKDLLVQKNLGSTSPPNH